MRTINRPIATSFSLILCLLVISEHQLIAQNAISDTVASLSQQVEFAIESQLFVGNSKSPQSSNLTLFSHGVVYDFPNGNNANETYSEIVIYDSATKKTTLVDLQRKIRLDLHDVQVIRILDGVRKASQEDERTKFLVQDDYEEVIDADERTISLSGDNLSYHVTGGSPTSEKLLPIYFEFLGVFTRLQATDPTKLPPFPRLRLNSVIRRVGWMPERVDIKVEKNAMFKEPFAAHSKHKVIKDLSEHHREMISEAKRYWLSYKAVDLATYRRFKTDPQWQRLIRTASADNK